MTDRDDTEDDPDLSEVRPGERIAKTIARAGLGSRREAEAWIAAGRVAVNGTVIDTPAVNVTRADRVTVDGKALPERERTRLWLFHKPRGLVTTNHDPDGRPTIFGALPPELPRVMTVGRLDINTEGLLLLTNDGGLARVLELPSTGWLRKYRVRAHGEVKEADLQRLREGMAVDGILYGPIEASLDQASGHNAWLTLGLREGKNREIKNVLGALGLEVSRLIRVSFGPFQLGGLARGAVEEVRTRMLKDQLGPRLAEAAGADFSGPAILPPPPAPRTVRPAPTAGPARGGRPGAASRGPRKAGPPPGAGDRPRGKPYGADRGPRRDAADPSEKPKRLLFDVAEDGVGRSETWVPRGAGNAAAVGRDDRARIRPSAARPGREGGERGGRPPFSSAARGDRPAGPAAARAGGTGRAEADARGFPGRGAGERGHRSARAPGDRAGRAAGERGEGTGRAGTDRRDARGGDGGGRGHRSVRAPGDRAGRASGERGAGTGRAGTDRPDARGGDGGDRGGRNAPGFGARSDRTAAAGGRGPATGRPRAERNGPSARDGGDRDTRPPRRFPGGEERGARGPGGHGEASQDRRGRHRDAPSSPSGRGVRPADASAGPSRKPRPVGQGQGKGDRGPRPVTGRGAGTGDKPKGRRPGGAAPRGERPGGGRKGGR